MRLDHHNTIVLNTRQAVRKGKKILEKPQIDDISDVYL